jgi:hypothetical protein
VEGQRDPEQEVTERGDSDGAHYEPHVGTGEQARPLYAATAL